MIADAPSQRIRISKNWDIPERFTEQIAVFVLTDRYQLVVAAPYYRHW